jgi:hypothetical protein
MRIYYRQYERLMVRWREVLPVPNLELHYEDLIVRQEEVTRKLLAHCGLDWNESCLSFYNTRRTVQTASTIQVRRCPRSPWGGGSTTANSSNPCSRVCRSAELAGRHFLESTSRVYSRG